MGGLRESLTVPCSLGFKGSLQNAGASAALLYSVSVLGTSLVKFEKSRFLKTVPVQSVVPLGIPLPNDSDPCEGESILGLLLTNQYKPKYAGSTSVRVIGDR